MNSRALQFALFSSLLMAGTAPRTADGGVIASCSSECSIIDPFATATDSRPEEANGSNSEIDHRGVLGAFPLGRASGAGASSSTSPSVGNPGMLSASIAPPPPGLAQKLHVEVKLLFPNPPPLGLLRPPRV